jgi:methionine synthase II (cobalamin-independent)
MAQTKIVRPLGIGSLPHVNIEAACGMILDKLPESPFWPELPRLDWRESMGVEQARGLPGAIFDDRNKRVFFDLDQDLTGELERFYDAFINGRTEEFAISSDFLPGLEMMTRLVAERDIRPVLLKGQLTGPTTLGLILKDSHGRALLYDEQMMDVLVKATRLKASWMILKMAPLCDTPVVFFDEPMLQSIGSASIPIDKSVAVSRLNEIIDGLDCISGGHCCGNTDWSIMMAAGLDVIAYDAWSFGGTLGLYGDHLVDFIRRGGRVAWGVVPATTEGSTLETEAITGKLLDLISETAGSCGMSPDELKSGYITPSCGLGSLSEAEAEIILDKTASIANALSL